jgi:hypothetical protein
MYGVHVESDFACPNNRCWQDIKHFNFKYSLFEGEKMNCEFDGMYLYEYMGDSQPKYVIRGNYIHGFKKTWEPAYEILGACRGINPKALNSFTFNILFLLYIL